MSGCKHLILACLLATCSALRGNLSRYMDAADSLHGPLCYSCSYLTDPRICDTEVYCGRDEICMLHELMPGADGTKRFTAHCETELVCQNLRNHVKRAHVFCHNCCDQDLCNDHCGSTPTLPTTQITSPTPALTKAPTPVPTTLPIPTTTTHPAPPPTTAHHTQVNYPIMCYSCEKVTDIKSCRHLVTCKKGFGCMLQDVGIDADFQIVYKLSCEPDWLCNRMPHSADALIGKRSVFGHSYGLPKVVKRSSTCNKCCHQHLCNGHCDMSSQLVPVTPTPMPTTHKTTTQTKKTTTNGFSATPLHVKTRGTTVAQAQSPVPNYNQENCIKHNFTSIPYISLCFKLETVALSWSIAERWCGFYGATLAVLDDPGKFSVVQTVLRYEPHFQNEIVYTGGHDDYNNGTFYWPHQRRVSIGSWSGLNFQHSTGKCIALDGKNGFQMAFVDCDKYRKFVCTIDTS